MNEIPIDDFKRLYRIEGGRAVKISDAGSVATSNRVAGGRAAQRLGEPGAADMAGAAEMRKAQAHWRRRPSDRVRQTPRDAASL